MNGQAITLANKHKDNRDPSKWKGMKFAVPFEYSMHNFLLRYYIAQAGLDKNIQLIARDSELELRFNGALHFVSGTANLNKESQYVLNRLVDIVKRTVKADSVSVEGHTDDEPIFSTVYPSNWELSASRASTVVREFEKYGFDPAKLTAKGFGSSRPLLPNRDSKGDPLKDNQEINRRVIVTIGFRHEMSDAVKAMKTNEFVSADAPELDPKTRTPLVREGEGETTWKEKVSRDISAVQEKLKLAEDRLKETEEKNRSAKQLAEMQDRLKKVEKDIEVSETETQKVISSVGTVAPKTTPPPTRKPASVKSRKKIKKAVTQKAAPVVTAPAPATAPDPDGAPPPPPVDP